MTCPSSSPAPHCKASTHLLCSTYGFTLQFFTDDFRQEAPEKYQVECQKQVTEQHRQVAAMALQHWRDWALNIALRFLADIQKDRHCQFCSSCFQKGVKVHPCLSSKAAFKFSSSWRHFPKQGQCLLPTFSLIKFQGSPWVKTAFAVQAQTPSWNDHLVASCHRNRKPWILR